MAWHIPDPLLSQSDIVGSAGPAVLAVPMPSVYAYVLAPAMGGLWYPVILSVQTLIMPESVSVHGSGASVVEVILLGRGFWGGGGRGWFSLHSSFGLCRGLWRGLHRGRR